MQTDPTPKRVDAEALAKAVEGDWPCSRVLVADQIRALARERNELVDALDIITLNAIATPDPCMGGATDIYAVPIDDIDTARALISRHRAPHA